MTTYQQRIFNPTRERIQRTTLNDTTAAADKDQALMGALTGYDVVILGIMFHEPPTAHSAGTLSVHSNDTTPIVVLNTTTVANLPIGVWIELVGITTATGKTWYLKHGSGVMTYSVKYAYTSDVS